MTQNKALLALYAVAAVAIPAVAAGLGLETRWLNVLLAGDFVVAFGVASYAGLPLPTPPVFGRSMAQTIPLPAGQAITIVNAVSATPTPTPTPTPVPAPPPTPGPVSSYPRPIVAFINQSTVLADTVVYAIMQALQIQVDRDFAPIWYRGAQLTYVKAGTPPPSNAWQLVFLDDSDQAGALGYHDLTAQGMPLGKVFAKTDMKYGLQTSVTASHELLEMLADPFIDELRGVYTYQGTQALFAQEVGDPVEADALGYQINGQQVSDFVTRNYFHPGMPGPYSFRNNVSAPLTLSHGGYMSYLPITSSGWKQVQAETLPGERIAPGNPRFEAQPGSRRERRLRGRENWKRSER